MRLVNLETREVRPVPCGRLMCHACARYLAWRRALAMGWARPERRFDLTAVGEDWDTVRARIKRLRYDIVDAGYDCEWSWMVEPNPRGTGHHVHGYQSGSYIPQAELAAMADRRGLGVVVYIKALAGSRATGYGLKALSYGLKGHSAEDSHRMHLDLNGGRLSHHSRGFYGVPVREAERLALDQLRGGEASSWVVSNVTELDRLFARPLV